MIEEWTDFFKPGILFKYRHTMKAWEGVFLFVDFENPGQNYIVGKCLSPMGKIKRFKQYTAFRPEENWEVVKRKIEPMAKEKRKIFELKAEDYYKDDTVTIEDFFVPGKLYMYGPDEKTIYMFMNFKHTYEEKGFYVGNFLWIADQQPHIATTILKTKDEKEYWLLWRRCEDGDKK